MVFFSFFLKYFTVWSDNLQSTLTFSEYRKSKQLLSIVPIQQRGIQPACTVPGSGWCCRLRSSVSSSDEATDGLGETCWDRGDRWLTPSSWLACQDENIHCVPGGVGGAQRRSALGWWCKSGEWFLRYVKAVAVAQRNAKWTSMKLLSFLRCKNFGDWVCFAFSYHKQLERVLVSSAHYER